MYAFYSLLKYIAVLQIVQTITELGAEELQVLKFLMKGPLQAIKVVRVTISGSL